MLGFLYRRPINLIIAMNIFAFTLLFFYKKTFDQVLLVEGILVIGLICTTYFVIIKKSLGDEYLFLIVSMLASLGIVMISRLDETLAFKQIVWFTVGIIVFFLTYYIFLKFRFWDKLLFYFIGVSFLLFAMTLVLGKNIKGSTNWIVIYGYSFQPSELIKITYLFSLACFFKKSKQILFKGKEIQLEHGGIKGKLVLMGIAYFFMGFLIIQKEWGTALLMFVIFFMMVYIFDSNIRFFLANTALAAIGSLGGYLYVYHIKIRVKMWLDPWSDIAGKGYQITQSLFAIGAGGFFGTGIGMGKPDLIPEVNTDFIFSAICEEMGIFGGVAVILLFFILVYRGFKIALTIKDTFKKAVALGITMMFGIQTFIIIGGVIKLIPLTGITLPFISYGGSSLTTSFIALGILQALSSRPIEEEAGEMDEGE